MDSINDKQFTDWARLIQCSDRQAFKKLFDATFEGYVRYAWRFTKDKSSAMDIVQDCFVKLWEVRQNIDPEQSLKSYIYRMVKNRAINSLRDSKYEESGLDEVISNVSVGPEVYEVDEQDDRLSPLIKWIDNLPERQQEAFKLSRFEGLSHDEIAAIMDVSPRTVNNHIVAALKSLQEKSSEFQKLKQSVV
jgi:RNA polymerase sigma-70 factor (ECF subfamily)